MSFQITMEQYKSSQKNQEIKHFSRETKIINSKIKSTQNIVCIPELSRFHSIIAHQNGSDCNNVCQQHQNQDCHGNFDFS